MQHSTYIVSVQSIIEFYEHCGSTLFCWYLGYAGIVTLPKVIYLITPLLQHVRQVQKSCVFNFKDVVKK